MSIFGNRGGGFSPESMRKRFHELSKIIKDTHARSDPVRAKRDKMEADHHAQISALNKQIKEIEASLFELKNEQAAIARALGGKTGKPA